LKKFVSRVPNFEEVTNWVPNAERHSNWVPKFQISRISPSSFSVCVFRLACDAEASEAEAGAEGTRTVIVGRSNAGLFPRRLRLRSVNGPARIADDPSIHPRFTSTIREGNRFESHKVPVGFVFPV
jgi:hypothetical protein